MTTGSVVHRPPLRDDEEGQNWGLGVLIMDSGGCSGNIADSRYPHIAGFESSSVPSLHSFKIKYILLIRVDLCGSLNRLLNVTAEL